MTTILGLKVPDGQSLWFWNCGGDVGHLLFAADYDEAYAKAIQARLDAAGDTAESVENAQRWFSKNDTLVEVVAEYAGPAFAGELKPLD